VAGAAAGTVNEPLKPLLLSVNTVVLVPPKVIVTDPATGVTGSAYETEMLVPTVEPLTGELSVGVGAAEAIVAEPIRPTTVKTIKTITRVTRRGSLFTTRRFENSLNISNKASRHLSSLKLEPLKTVQIPSKSHKTCATNAR